MPWFRSSAKTTRPHPLRAQLRTSIILDELNDPVLFIARDARIVDANRRAEEFYGYSRSELLKMSAYDIRPKEDHAALPNLLDMAAQLPGRVFRTEHLRRDGVWVPVEVSTRYLAEEEIFLSIVRDISERRVAEQRIRALNRLLRTRSAVDEAIVHEHDRDRLLNAVCRRAVEAGELLSVMVGLAEPDGRITIAAQSGVALAHLDNDAIRWDAGPKSNGPGGRAIRERRTIAIADTQLDEQFAPWRKGALASGIRSLASAPLYIRNQAAGFISFAASEPNVFDEDVLDLVGTLGADVSFALEVIDDRLRHEEHQRQARDVQQRLEEELRQAQKMEAVGRLAGGIAHDFNNLLTVILGNCSEALDALPDGHPQRGNVSDIEAAANRAATLTRQLLAFSRRQILRPEPLDLNQVVTKIGAMLRRVIGEDITLLTHLDADAGYVLADPGQVEQILLNLCINARDAMPGGGTLTIETTRLEIGPAEQRRDPAMQQGPHVCIVVRDTGSGMTDDVKAQAFEPFFTTKEQGKGTGLGLSTVYGIVRQSRGGIFFDSVVGTGTTFVIALPALEAPPAPASHPAAEPRAERGVECVLIAEDEPGVRALARRALVAAGYGVIEAGSGEDALTLAQAHSGGISLLITDVVMPGMNGAELAQEMKQIVPDIKVLYMSGYAESELLRNLSADVGASFLQKPFTVAEMRSRVRQLLDH